MFAAMGGEEMTPVLHGEFTDAATWEVLMKQWAALDTHP